MSAHTPGPWNVACESGEWFATLQDYSPIPCTLENARLIAAAPDLLKALKDTHALLQATLLVINDPEARTIARQQLDANRAAIAKAENI